MSSVAPAITVVIPVRNSQSTIRRAVVSTLRDLPDNGRMIVRDDASTDRTVAAISDIKDARLEIVRGESLGIAESMNELIDRTETPLIARMDGDDHTLPGRFRRQLRAIAAGSDIAFTTVFNWKSGTPLMKPQPLVTIGPAGTPIQLLLDNPFMNPTMLARTKVLKELGGCRQVPSEDYELWLRAASAGYRLSRDAVPMVLYRRHTTQITAQKTWRAAQAHTNIVEQSFNELGSISVGFVPSWFAWRRDGFAKGQAPAAVAAELDSLDRKIAELPVQEQRSLNKRVAFIRTRL